MESGNIFIKIKWKIYNSLLIYKFRLVLFKRGEVKKRKKRKSSHVNDNTVRIDRNTIRERLIARRPVLFYFNSTYYAHQVKRITSLIITRYGNRLCCSSSAFIPAAYCRINSSKIIHVFDMRPIMCTTGSA